MKIPKKSYLALALLAVILFIMIVSNCHGFSIFVNANYPAQCNMHQIESSSSQSKIIKDIFLALPVTGKNIFALFNFLILIPLSLLSFYFVLKSSNYNYWLNQYIFNMKPWDPLRYAFSQGIIHSKHLD